MGIVRQQLEIKGEVQVRLRRIEKSKESWRSPFKKYADWIVLPIVHNGFPDAGIDWIAAQLYMNTSAGTRGAGCIALSNNGTAPDNADTVLSGELTTADMARADAAVKTHTNGTNVSVVKHTFTASATRTGIVKTGLFNVATAPPSGILVNEALIASTDLNSGDQIEITWTVTGPTAIP